MNNPVRVHTCLLALSVKFLFPWNTGKLPKSKSALLNFISLTMRSRIHARNHRLHKKRYICIYQYQLVILRLKIKFWMISSCVTLVPHRMILPGLYKIIRISTFTPANSELLCVHDTLGEINNIMEAAIFIHLIHHFVAKVREVTQSSGSSL